MTSIATLAEAMNTHLDLGKKLTIAGITAMFTTMRMSENALLALHFETIVSKQPSFQSSG